MRRASGHLAAAVLFVTLTLLMLWPLPRLVARAAVSPREPLVNAWRYDRAWHQLRHGVFEREQFGIALVGFPMRAAGAPPLLTHNILLLLGFAVSGYGAFVLAKLVTGSWWAGLVSGIAFAFTPWRFAHLAETQHAWSGWLPLAAAAVVAFALKRTWVRGTMLAATLVMAWLTWSGGQGRFVFPGFAVALLALIGLIGPLGRDAKLRRVVLLAALIAIAVGYFLAPVVAYAGIALLAGIGAMKLIRHRHAIGVVIAAILIFELRPNLPRFHLIDTDEPPVYRYLAQSGRGAILELPMGYDDSLIAYLFRSTIHHRPVVREPKLAVMFERRPIDFAVLDALGASGVTTIVVHNDEIVGTKAALVRDFLFRAVEAGRLKYVARFDRGVEGDYVFELGRGDAKPFFGPQPLSRPVAYLDEPQEGAELRGLVRVSGWALAPDGIKRVRVYVDNHDEHVDAQLFPRLDVGALYPWHDATKAGFTIDIPRRKREGKIDVEVEVMDSRGRIVRLPQRWFVWSR